MDDMARYPGLVRRKARWYLRSRIPADLTDFLKRAEVWRSLGTVEYREALRRYTSARLTLQRWFDAQRRRRDIGEKLNGEVPRLVVDWSQAACADFTLSGDLLRSALGEAEQELAELLDGDADEDVTTAADQDVTTAVNAVLIAAGWPARSHTVGAVKTRIKVVDGEVPGAIHELVRRALVELARRRRERLRGSPIGASFDPLFSSSTHVQPGAPNGQDHGLTVGELIEKFEADRAPRIGFSKAVEYGMLFRVLKELWGEHKPVREIAREDCRRVRDLLANLPPHASNRWPRLSLRQAAERARVDGLAVMSPTTVNAYAARLSTLFRWATREEFVARNPAEGLQVNAPDDPRDARRPFAPSQLQCIFAAPPFVPRDDSDATFWAPLIALFGGLRLSEITGLGTADVTAIDGVDLVLVQPDHATGRRLKTRVARRIVPVHPQLTKIGFLDYVARQRKAGHDRLFPELKLDRRGYYTDAIQKKLNRQIERAGASGERQSFHSFRHNFRDALREADVSRDAVLALGGWRAGGTEEIYGGGLKASTLARELAHIRYDGLDLGPLHPR
jgi:integrase